MDLTEAEDIKKRRQEFTEELYKKDLHDPDNHDGVIIHLEPDILEYKVKWALGSITMNKASGDDGIPAELFQILKMMLLKCCTNMPTNLENSTVATGWEKVFSSNPKERECQRKFKLLHNFTHFTCSKMVLKILQTSLQQYMNQEPPDVQDGFRRGRGTRDQILNIHWIIEKARESRKTSTSTSLAMLKPLTVWITTNWKILKEMGIPDHPTCLLRTCMQVKKQQLKSDMEEWTGSKS